MIAVALMGVAMLATPFIGAVLAGYGGKNRATFGWYLVQWPVQLIGTPEETRAHVIEKEDGMMYIVHNILTYGEPPVPEVTYVPGTNVVINPIWDAHPAGGIRLTVTPEGEAPYILVGTFEKTMLWIQMTPREGMLENSRWSFTITGYEGETVPPEGYMDSTMSGTIKNIQGGSEMEIKSTKGTGIFEGAFLRGTHITQPGIVPNTGTPPPAFTLLSTSTGSGEIVFP